MTIWKGKKITFIFLELHYVKKITFGSDLYSLFVRFRIKNERVC